SCNANAIGAALRTIRPSPKTTRHQPMTVRRQRRLSYQPGVKPQESVPTENPSANGAIQLSGFQRKYEAGRWPATTILPSFLGASPQADMRDAVGVGGHRSGPKLRRAPEQFTWLQPPRRWPGRLSVRWPAPKPRAPRAPRLSWLPPPLRGLPFLSPTWRLYRCVCA